MRIAILEDDAREMKKLKSFFARFQEENSNVAFTIDCFGSGKEMMDSFSCNYEAVFLDIQVPDLNGMEVAHRIRKQDESVRILFITNLVSYAIEGYSVQAFDYVLKPLSYTNFKAKIHRLLRTIAVQDTEEYVQVKTKEGLHRINTREITYLEVRNHDLQIHLVSGECLKQWGSLARYEKELQESGFARCNSCYLVNLRYVNGVQGDFVLVGNDSLIISGPKRKGFLDAFARYMGGVKNV